MIMASLTNSAALGEQPATAAPTSSSIPTDVVYNPFHINSRIGRDNLLDKLIDDPEIPTAKWACMGHDGSCLLLELPRLPEDGPYGFRYRCGCCHSASKSQFDRLPGRPAKVNQMNVVWKHLCRNEHWKSLEIVSSQEKSRRVTEVIPKLHNIIARNAARKKPRQLRFSTVDVMRLEQTTLKSNVDLAYQIAFIMGMQGNALSHQQQLLQQEQCQPPAPVQTPGPEAVPMHQIQHMHNPPPIHPPGNFQTPTTNSFFRAEPATAAMLDTVPPGLLQMYKSTQRASAMFNHHERPKS
jgi:hypothetical protein